ncbi:Ger(x)C family spore germination protein [Fictibacillus barbaricus]|uniref:Ger(X)C family spore germination protein n=1 Tax=Fictibacillus barbaricus TaxID=182136 RepID=A0ABS2Z9V2_9BACL|nr:Ger(x)C family spore germination protein [Fictibacillus barbaricus]MBN3544943.1 Ger(x)C family spore germination protein [Fictibacillus barbaricus]GGB62911.1 germination protein [Fictibacillus barbaricus]
MKSFLILPVLIILLLVTGCAKKNILEETGLITTVGFDMASSESILTTMVVLQIDPEAKRNVDILSSSADTSKGSRIDANLKTPKELQAGQLRVALYNEKIARKGLRYFADTMARDPSVSDLIYIGIVEGSAHDTLNHDYKNIPDIGRYLYNQFEQLTEQEQILNPTLQDVQQSLYSVGMDPIIPLVKRKGETIANTGSAILRNDKMVGKLSPYKSFFVKLIRDDFRAGNIELHLDLKNADGKNEKVVTVLDTIKTSSDLKLTDPKIPHIDAKLKITARLLEIRGKIDLTNPKNIKLLEKKIGQKLEQDTLKVIRYCQEKNSDVFGFGEVYRSSVRHSNLTMKEWHEKYKNLEAHVSVDFSLVRTGVTE